MATEAPFRIALRTEGSWWIAYLASPITMDGAIEIARVRLAPAQADPAIKQAFIDFTQRVMEAAAKASLQEIAHWNAPTPARR